MSTIKLSDIETRIASEDFGKLSAHVQSAQAGLATAATAQDVKDAICGVWSKIRPFILVAENIPFIGKYVTILAQLLDSICPQG